jgi:hypothetical protein
MKRDAEHKVCFQTGVIGKEIGILAGLSRRRCQPIDRRDRRSIGMDHSRFLRGQSAGTGMYDGQSERRDHGHGTTPPRGYCAVTAKEATSKSGG